MSTRLGTFSVCLLAAALVILAGCAKEEDWQENDFDYQYYLNSLETFRAEVLTIETIDYNGDGRSDLHLQVLSQGKQHTLVVTFRQYPIEESYRKYLVNPRWNKESTNPLTFLQTHLRPGSKIMIPTSKSFNRQEDIDYRFIYLEGDSFNFPENI
ncbi:MAG TPA: hypothetical protein VJB39_00870 [Patescibacteria group bacterium]|nr:hypothetical protein [Patescibacteria group bacterium]